MPLCADKTVYCVTQLLKCLFGTNMVNQYSDFMSILDKNEGSHKSNFFNDVMMTNTPTTQVGGSRRSSISSNASQKLSLDSKNPRMAVERQLLITMENFAKNKSDRKWSTNKKELERYIRLFEPVVIQSLKVSIIWFFLLRTRPPRTVLLRSSMQVNCHATPYLYTLTLCEKP